MKKLFALLAVVLAVVSCQKDVDNLDVNVGGEQLVNITVTLPEAETRATDPDWANSAEGAFVNEVLKGNATMRYILQVYYNGKTNADNRQVQYSDNATVSFPVRLVPGRNYQFVVWADVVDGVDADSEYYYTADLKNITLKDGKWEAMDEKRDAFTASETINFNGALAINIPLYRPFAKLRVVTTDYDELAKQPGGAITPHHAVVTYYTKHRTAFNAYTSKPADASELIAHEYVIKTYGNELNVTDDHTIFADYFFAEDDVVRFELSVYEANGELIKTTSFPTDINVKRNFLTTLKGNVLTEGGNISVTVNPEFGNPDNDYNVVTSADDLLKAIKNGGEYHIGNDITVNPGASALAATRTGAATTTTIDLNGYTITLNVDINLGGNNLIIAGEGSVVSDNNKIVNGNVVVTGDANIDNGIVSATTGIAALQYICANGGTFTLSEDLTINAETEITANEPVVINGNDHIITFTCDNGIDAKRGFRITANTVAFENVTIVNKVKDGRCVNTLGNIDLTFNNVILTATEGASQPLTVGGSGTNITVNLNNSTVEANKGYGITTFNPVALNINNSTVSGYAALNIKSGSADSEINVVNSTLAGTNNAASGDSNGFATVEIEDNDIEINIDGNSTLKANAKNNPQALFRFGNSQLTETFRGCNIVVAVDAKIDLEGANNPRYVGLGANQKYLYDNVVKFPAKYAADLEAEGWVVSERVDGLVTLLNSVVVKTADELKNAVNNATCDVVVSFGADINGGKIVLTHKPNINVTILGNGKTYTGGINIFGQATDNDTMTFKNIHFDGTGLGDREGCIYTHLDVPGYIGHSYVRNLTIEDCTFTGNGVAAIRQNNGGDRNWTIKNCTVDNTMHSHLQVQNVEGGLVVENCKVYSKNGANLNNTFNASFTGCNFDVQGYAVRVGVNDSNAPDPSKLFNFKECTLKSANDDGDAVVIVRANASKATLNFENTTLIGDPEISGATEDTKINRF